MSNYVEVIFNHSAYDDDSDELLDIVVTAEVFRQKSTYDEPGYNDVNVLSCIDQFKTECFKRLSARDRLIIEDKALEAYFDMTSYI